MLSCGRIWGAAGKKSNCLLIESRIAPMAGTGNAHKNYLLIGEFVATSARYEIIAHTSPHGRLHGRFRHHHLRRQLRRMHGWGKERQSQDRRRRPELTSEGKNHREAATSAAFLFSWKTRLVVTVQNIPPFAALPQRRAWASVD